MYIKIENRENGRRFTFFSREREINGVKVTHTEKSVFGTLSEGIKTGENNGQPIYENDYWNTVFCGKAYEKALTLKDKDRVSVVEFTIRNQYNKTTKKNYPSIMVTDFDIIGASVEDGAETVGDGFLNIPDGIDGEYPFE